MWSFLQGLQDQVTKYATFIGQLWYLCVFVFRLIVVVTIGDAVYSGELGEFSCSTTEPGCTTMCFNQFNKMSHIRFWSFQLLAIATPTVIFHFYSTSVTGQIEKLQQEQENLKKPDESRSEYSLARSDPSEEIKEEKQKHKVERHKKKIGNIRFKKVFAGNELQQVAYTNKIHFAYAGSVMVRMVIEGVFIYFAYQLYKIWDTTDPEEAGALDFLLIEVPGMFSCKGLTSGVQKACSQAVMNGGAVPCWVARPWEKTILILYMNVLSGICFLLNGLELVYLSYKAVMAGVRRTNKKFRADMLQNQRRVVQMYTHNNHLQVNMPVVSDSIYPPLPDNGSHVPGYGYHNPLPARTITEYDGRSVISTGPKRRY